MDVGETTVEGREVFGVCALGRLQYGFGSAPHAGVVIMWVVVRVVDDGDEGDEGVGLVEAVDGLVWFIHRPGVDRGE